MDSELGKAVQDSPWKKLERIGRGSYGEVYKGVHVPSGTLVAIKTIPLEFPNVASSNASSSSFEELISEISLLSHCSSPYITRYLSSFLVATSLWILMEFSPYGSFRGIIGKLEGKRVESPFVMRYLAKEMATGLSYLHKNGIIHRDIKAANLLLSGSNCLQICDFGVSGLILPHAGARRYTFVGSPYWMAPEVIRVGSSPSATVSTSGSGGGYDSKADVWSYGITLIELFTGRPPYYQMDANRAIMMIINNPPPTIDLVSDDKETAELKEFIDFCLHDDPHKRPTADDLLKHKYLKNVDLSKKQNNTEWKAWMKQVHQVVGRKVEEDIESRELKHEPFELVEEPESKLKQSETAWLFDSRSTKSQSTTFDSRSFEKGSSGSKSKSHNSISMNNTHSDTGLGSSPRAESRSNADLSERRDTFDDPMNTLWSHSSPSLVGSRSANPEWTSHARSLDFSKTPYLDRHSFHLDDMAPDSLSSDLKDPFFSSGSMTNSVKSVSSLSMRDSSYTGHPYPSHVSSTFRTLGQSLEPLAALTTTSNSGLLDAPLPESMELQNDTRHSVAFEHVQDFVSSHNMQSTTLNKYDELDKPADSILSSTSSLTEPVSGKKSTPSATSQQEKYDANSILSFILGTKAPFDLSHQNESVDQMLETLIGQYERLGMVLESTIQAIPD